MNEFRLPTSVDGSLRVVLLAVLVASLFAPPRAGAEEQDLDQWIQVPFTGTITTQRTILGVSQIGDLSTEMKEEAKLTATITRSVEIFNDQGDSMGWFPEGTVRAEYNGTQLSTGPPEAQFTTKTKGEGTKSDSMRYDPERARWVDLQVNPGKRRYRLSLPNVEIQGVYTETTTIAGQVFESATEKSWETGGELERGFMILGERPYDPASGIIAGSDSFDARQSSDPGIRGTTVRTLKALEPGALPAVLFTVNWQLRIGESPGRLVLEPEELYTEWIPEGTPEQTTALSVIQVTARLVEPEDAEGIIEFRLDEFSREPGACLNFPFKDDDRSMDMVFSVELNADLKMSEDSLSVKTFHPEKEVTVFLEARDYGAWAKLTATATIVTGKGETEIEGVYERLGTPYVTLPMDDDNNRIADAWQKRHGVEGQGIDDEDDQPAGEARGDGISLYEEYRGFYIQGQHRRLDPKVKDLFIYDRDGLAQDSFLVAAASPIEVHFLRDSEVVAEPGRDGYRVVNLNYETFHLVDQHAVVVINDHDGPDGIMGHCHGECQNPGTAEPYVSVYVANIEKAIDIRIENWGEQISEKLGRPLDAAWRESHVRAYTRNTTTHEMGHAIGIEHHGPPKCMPPGANQDKINPSYGSWNCVMRYLYDMRLDEPAGDPYPQPIKESDDVLAIMKDGWPWPHTYCQFCDCRKQFRISDAGN